MSSVSTRAVAFTSRETESIILVLIGGLLTGYALFSKGFAYMGTPPLFVGEMVLGGSLCLFLIRPNFRLLFSSRIGWCLGVFCLLCLFQTLPYLQTYGLLALRDATVYGYALYALIVGTLMARQDRMRTMLVGFEIASWGVIVLSPFVIYIMLKHGGLQGDHVPFIFQKAGDLAVHLAGAGSFRLVGLNQRAATRSSGLRRLADLTFWACWLICAVWSASVSRSGLLTIVVSMAIVFAMGYGRRIILLAGSAVLAAGIILGALQIGVRHQGSREISMVQLLANSLSIVGDARGDFDSGVDLRSLQANTSWRLNWWGRIVDDTLSTDHFWTGRGFGLNLATADGFQVDARESLRSPHSIQMTILARVGVPGLLAWLVFLSAMAAALVLQGRRMRHLGHRGWHALNVWVLTYWVSTIVNGSFDVYMEGPQGGIWSWCLVGLGIALVELEKQVPTVNRAIRSGVPEF